jgi:Bacterial Ig-like domain (group 3)
MSLSRFAAAVRLGSRSVHAWRRFAPALLFFTLGWCFSVAAAQTTIHVPQDQPTIQAGIDAAQNGDTVLVAPGTYNENIDFKGKAITVISADGPKTTTIHGDGTTAVVVFHSKENRSSVISGFTITGGGYTAQGGIGYGGGVEASDAAPSILNNIITGNQCHAVGVDFGAALIQGNTMKANTPSSDGYCNFDGSAVLLIGSSQAPQPGFSEVIGNTIANNGPAIGGGLMLWAVEGTVIESNIIAGNTTTGQGGALTSYNSDAMIIAQNLVVNNSATYGAGGISVLAPDSTLGPFIGMIQNNTFAGNTLSNPDRQGTDSASQVFLEGNLGQFEFTDNIVVGSNALPAFMCGATYNDLSLTPLVIDHNDIYNSAGSAYGGACPDQTGQYGNISADPLFVSAATSDFHLLKGSAAIDAGNNSALQLLANAKAPITTDLDGNARVQDASGKGYPVIDMGAYEYAGAKTGSPTTIVLTPSAYDNVDAGEPLTLTAQLYSPLGIPTGSVTFYEDGQQIGSSNIGSNGAAVWNSGSSLTPGTHAFLATYAGEQNFTPAESVKIYVVVNKYGVTLTLASSANPSLAGQSITFKATVRSSDGSHPSPLSLADNGMALATLTPDSSGAATYTTNSLTLGFHIIQVSYAGDATHYSAYATVSQQVVNGYATNTSLGSSLNPANAGQAVTFTATVTSAQGTPTGSMVFADGATTLATVPLAGGAASYSTGALAAGRHAITATYSPSGDFTGSSASLTETINGAPTSLLLASSVNPPYALQPVTLTARVTSTAAGTPTGSVSFSDGGVTLGSATLTAGGTARLTVKFASAGLHALSASYSGDANFNASSGGLAETVSINTSATALQAQPGAPGAFVPVTLTAGITSATAAQYAPGAVPAGSVTFYDGAASLGTVTLDATGAATLQLSSFQAGTHMLTAAYSGNASFQPSASADVPLPVTPDATTAKLAGTPSSAAAGTTVTFTAAVASAATTVVPTGAVTFYDGATPLGQAALDATGHAAFGTSSLAIGMHTITASYGGDRNFQASRSTAFVETITPFLGDFTLSVSPGVMSIYTGEASKATVTAVAQGGFRYDLALSCSGLPAGAACNFASPAIAAGNGSVAVTLQTAPPHAIAAFRRPAFLDWPRSGTAGALACLLFFLAPRRKRRGLLLLILFGIAASTFSACSNPVPLTGGTPPGTYTVTVTAQTSNAGQTLAHTAVLKLTVKSLF